MVIITSKQEGFRRCGEAHAVAPTEWPDDRWTQEELAALAAEPMLVVLQGEAADPEPPKGKGGKTKEKTQPPDPEGNQSGAAGVGQE